MDGSVRSKLTCGVSIDSICYNGTVIPKDLVLEGERVRLEPLTFAHAADLFAAGNDPDVWRGAGRSNQMPTLERACEYIAEAAFGCIESPGAIPFAIVERSSRRAIGSTRFFEISALHRRLEIGYTWIAREFWRTAVNTECKFLLLRYAFEEAGIRRVQLKADAENTRSRTAILRLGASYEGTFRDFRVLEGRVRSVSFYSILESEWPAVKARLLNARSSAAQPT